MNEASRMSATAADDVIDFSVHGLIGIRLIGASPSDARLVEKHLGIEPGPFAGEPALTFRFVDEIDVAGHFHWLGREDVGFTETNFVILRDRSLTRARAIIPFDRLTSGGEVRCERGGSVIPLLRPLINLAMLANGVLPVHAAAFRYRGRGVMVTGWSHGSKTGSLLAFMDQGAEYVGDEWIYVVPATNTMYGLPDHLEARPWYLAELPDLRRHVRLGDRLRTRLTSGVASLISPLVALADHGTSIPAKVARAIHQALLSQQKIELKPYSLFGADRCPLSSPLDIVIVAVSRNGPGVEVTPADPKDSAARMTASFLFEQSGLIAAYRKYRFAFPDRSQPWLDELENCYALLAEAVLAERKCFRMVHPYPVAICELKDTIEPIVV